MSASTTTSNRATETAWPRVRLGDVCRVVGGSTPKTGVEAFWSGDIVWVTPSDLGRLEPDRIADSDRRITQLGYESCGAEVVPPGSIVMSSRAPIGHLAIAAVPLCTNQGCKTFVPGPNVDSEFLFYRLKQAVPDLQALGSGATFAEVSKRQCEAFEIPLPPLQEQKRIATTLREQLDAAACMRAAASLQSQAAATLWRREADGYFLSHPVSLRPARPMNDVCLGRGQYGTSTRSNADERGLPVLGMANISGGRIKWSPLAHVDLPAGEMDKYRLDSGDLLVNRTNSAEWVGKSAVYRDERDAVFASYIVRFRVDETRVVPEFLCALINSTWGRRFIEANMTRAIGQVNISASTIGKLPVPLPPLPEQRGVVASLESVDRAAWRIQERAAAAVRDAPKLEAALLRRAFSGGV